MATIYLPVAAADVMEIASDWNSEAKRVGKPGYTIITNVSSGFVKAGRRLSGGGMLKMVPNTERLYVMIHGDGNTDEVTLSVGAERKSGREKSYSAAELARHLAKEGLNKAHKDLRLAVCNGGRADAGGVSFASELKAALSQIGYDKITVYGYIGEVANIRTQIADGSWRKTTETLSGDVRLKSMRVPF